MNGAFFYLSLKSAENLVRSRIARLKQPKYAMGLVIGALWFYFFFFRRVMGGYHPSVSHSGGSLSAEEMREMVLRVGAVVILGRAVYAWALPDAKAGIVFSVAEIAFLFPAPVTRRELIRYKLVSSQVKILFSSFFLMFISNRWGFLGGNPVTHAIGWWLILSVMNLHGTGASLTISRLIENGVSAGRRRLYVLGAVGGAAVLTLVSVIHAAPALPDFGKSGPLAMYAYVAQLLDSGLLHWLVWPFKFAVGPFAAPNLTAFAWALLPALALLVAHYYWVLSMESSFEEAAIAASEKRAAVIASVRAGNFRFGATERKVRKPTFRLADTGRPEIAFLWKNLLGTRAYFSPRVFFSCAIILIAIVSWIGNNADYGHILLLPIELMSCMLGFYIFAIGPQFARQDMRSDLPNTDILKAYPLQGWQVILGQILAPVAILTGLLWLALITATTAALHGGKLPGFDNHAAIIGTAIGVACLIPVLCTMQMLTSNAVAVVLPGWQTTGQARGQGMEVMGQRVIMSLGRLLVLALALLPAALLGGTALFSEYFIGAAAARLIAAAMIISILAGEIALGVWWIGRRFEKLDLSAETRL